MGKRKAGRHKGIRDEKQIRTAEETDEKVYNVFFDPSTDYGRRIIGQYRASKITGIPQATVDASFKRLLQAKRIRKVSGGYQLVDVQAVQIDESDPNNLLVQQIERRRKQIATREWLERSSIRKKSPEPEPPWLREIAKRKPVRSNHGS